MWFDQEDELEDGETIVPVADMLKGSKLDSDLDQINRLIENRKGIVTVSPVPSHSL